MKSAKRFEIVDLVRWMRKWHIEFSWWVGQNKKVARGSDYREGIKTKDYWFLLERVGDKIFVERISEKQAKELIGQA
ncbi:hypothetical protein [Atrimonas thermophila]|uniref:hypothetical protein n=1 Tax=Atrimonas thermophila TaxID=3064161 RepID=UPI00399C9D5D